MEIAILSLYIKSYSILVTTIISDKLYKYIAKYQCIHTNDNDEIKKNVHFLLINGIDSLQ